MKIKTINATAAAGGFVLLINPRSLLDSNNWQRAEFQKKKNGERKFLPPTNPIMKVHDHEKKNRSTSIHVNKMARIE